ncbi:MAG: plastocyanin/azurin family copper-binding protein [Flavobacteriales bacterium]
MIKKFFAIGLLSIAVACGNQAEKTEATESKEQTTQEENTEPGEREITVKVIGNSMADMAYDQTSITVNSGDQIKLTLINENEAEGMYHNIVFVKIGSGAEVAAEAIKAGKDKAYIPENPNVIAASPMAAPKETVTMEFTAPEKGSYNFICTYPGHFPLMVGKLIVK